MSVTKTRNVSEEYDPWENKGNYTKIIQEVSNLEYRNGDDSELITYIQENVDVEFNKNAFSKREIVTIPGDESDMIITYRYKIGDISTTFGYNVNIEDYKVKGIQSVGEKLYNYSLPVTISDSYVDELKEGALQDNQISDEVSSQTTDVYFDSVSKELVYKVTTAYLDAIGGEYCIETTY